MQCHIHKTLIDTVLNGPQEDIITKWLTKRLYTWQKNVAKGELVRVRILK